jgi:hypothetical protein
VLLIILQDDRTVPRCKTNYQQEYRSSEHTSKPIRPRGAYRCGPCGMWNGFSAVMPMHTCQYASCLEMRHEAAYSSYRLAYTVEATAV